MVEIASSFADKVSFLEIDTSTDSSATKLHNVRGVPTVIALYGDEELGRFVGTRSQDEIARIFAMASAGERVGHTISRTDRMLRIGIALVFAFAAIATGTPILWVFAVGAAVAAIWDLVRT